MESNKDPDRETVDELEKGEKKSGEDMEME